MRITLRDIAKRVNLSHATVSFVLNERMDVAIPTATRKRVLDAAREMGYRPNRAAQALVRGRTDMIALWVPLSSSNYYARVQRELVRLAAADNFEVVTRTYDYERKPEDGSWELDDWPVDGMIVLDCHFEGAGRFAPPRGAPVLSAGCFFDRTYDHIGIDLSHGVEEAMTHLYQAGCRRIAHLTGVRVPVSEPRHATYLRKCADLGLDSELIFSVTWDRAKLRETVSDYIGAHGAPDAILAQSDGLALAAMKGIRDAGLKVPDDILVVACDGTEEAEFAEPSLTTIAQPVTELCNRAWATLRERILTRREDPAAVLPFHAEVLSTELIVRASSVRPSQ